MHIHRTLPELGFVGMHHFTVQDDGLSLVARGLLADLLSRPDGWKEDARQIADRVKESRAAVAKALNELKRAGYYRVDKLRKPDGSIYSVAHLYDTPQLPVAVAVARRPGPGKAKAGAADTPQKKGGGKPSHPTATNSADVDVASEPVAPTAPEPAAPSVEEVSAEVREEVALLYRVLRPERRLWLGMAEALALVPLVTEWLKVGATERDLANALLSGLPPRVHAPAGLVRDRLTRKLPPSPAAQQPAAPARRRHECGKCAAPVPQPGICRACAGLVPRTPVVDADPGIGSSVTARGIARVRAALRSSRSATSPGVCAYGRGALTPTRDHGSPPGFPAVAVIT